jgi:hypothetical protein
MLRDVDLFTRFAEVEVGMSVPMLDDRAREALSSVMMTISDIGPTAERAVDDPVNGTRILKYQPASLAVRCRMPWIGHRRLLSVLLSLLLLILTLTVYVLVTVPEVDETVFVGSFFVSDSGESHGGWEYIATYTAELVLVETSGTLTLTLLEGPGDVLEKHDYEVASFEDLSTELRMDIDGNRTRLELVTDDKVWGGEFDGYYIAAYGVSSPPQEIIGEIAPETFPGVGSSFYVELRFPGPDVGSVSKSASSNAWQVIADIRSLATRKEL